MDKVAFITGAGGYNFFSIVAINSLAGCSDYAAAKGCVDSFTKALAKELGPYQINVNAVAPEIAVRPGEEEGNSERAFQINLPGCRCTGEAVANLVSFLASDGARLITAQTYVCDGGRSLSMKGTD